MKEMIVKEVIEELKKQPQDTIAVICFKGETEGIDFYPIREIYNCGSCGIVISGETK